MEKNEQILEIKRIIREWGGVTTSELELSSSPVYNNFGKDSFQLVERFNRDDVSVLSYVHETEVDTFDVEYENLNDDLVDEIYNIITEYDVAQHKLMDSCKDEDF